MHATSARRGALVALVVAGLTSVTLAQKDDFQREGEGPARKQKDALEGKPAPALEVANWLNVEGEKLDLAALRGKVVVLDFWGVW